MANKIQYYAQMAEETARQITGSREQWTAFLRAAARLYKYSYPDQLMIYAQRPDATACAEYDLWNQTMRRYVKRGSKGIALLDPSGDRLRLRYVFDVADTGTREHSRAVRPWSMEEAYREPVRQALAQEFSIQSEDSDTLELRLYLTAEHLTVDYWDRYREQLLDILAGRIRMDYDEHEIEHSFRTAMGNSVAYCLLSRCTEDPDRYFSPDDFQPVLDFFDRQAVNALGTAVSDLSERVFRVIERSIREYERSQALPQSQRTEPQQEAGQKPVLEGRDTHENGSHLHEEGGLSDPGHSVNEESVSGDRQIRPDEEGVSEREPADADERPDPDRDTVSAPAGSPADLEQADPAADEPASFTASGAGEKSGSDELDAAHEQPESAGGGDRDRGTDQQLSIAEFIPTEAEQIQTIDTMSQTAESEQLSAFSVSEEEVERVLRDGSGFANGKLRMQALYADSFDPKYRAAYLKDEYGNGGRSWTFSDGSRGSLDYSARGLLIRSYGLDAEQRLRWTDVEKRLETLIREGRYLSEEERHRYEALQVMYADTGGIPTPPPRQAFPSVAEREEAETDAVQETDSEDRAVNPVSSEETADEKGGSVPEEAAEDVVTGIPAVNFRIMDEHLGEGGPKEKFRRNVAAIETLLMLEAENRNATPEEQEILSQYVGWGGLPDAFDPEKENWAEEYTQLQELLSEQEYEMARASTLNAHYTSPVVIRTMYDAVLQMGFQPGNILEPSMGVGNFFGMLPEELKESRLYGVELDSISGRIAQKLYPKAEITVAGFETTDRRDFYDLAVGNVPFGNYKVHDRPYDRLGFSIHNYFFAKALDQVRPGGLVAFVTSRYTMDQKSPEVRKYLAERAELLGAVRLPNNAFRANAGTDVVSDILFLKKRERPIEIEADWIHLGQTPDGFAVNRYFVDHPEMVLGRFSAISTQYGRQDLTVLPDPDADLSDALRKALSHLEGQYVPQVVEEPDLTESTKVLPADPGVKNYSYTVVSGEVYFRENSVMTPVDLSDRVKGRIKGLVALRDLVNDLITLQLNDATDEEITGKQTDLNRVYDAFTAEYGLINSRTNAKAFSEDSSYYLLCSLENLDENGALESKADLFTKRTIRPERKVTQVDTPSEALAISIGERGRVDLPFMAQLLGTPGDYTRILEELRGVIFKDPTAEGGREDGWQTADEYLSGPVRRKLAQAKEAAQQNPVFQINVEALEKAQPKDLDASEIDVRLGATWLSPAIIKQFMQETFDIPYYQRRSIDVKYSPYTAEWRIEGKGRSAYHDVAARVTYGTDRASAYRILEETLNLKDIRIYDSVEDAEGKTKRVLNKKETTLTQQKQQAIKDAFRDWIWKDPMRREQLVKQYNELFNATRPREYDGSHIHFVGMNPAIKLREHQRGAIAHVLYGGNTLLAHEVGAGKTFEMVASAMESKRLGLSQKALFVVPNHLTLQWANEFLTLYPSARLLVAGKKDFETKHRKKFCAKIATGDYDAVIIGHSQFEKIPISAERQERMLREQIHDITDAIQELKNSHGENFSIKQMEKTRKSLQTRLDKLMNDERKDDVVTFEQLGVDRLYVDESHAYKNLFLYTKMRNVAGLSTSEAQKSADMFLKCRYMDEITGGKGIVFATGTPVSNSMTELYTVMRYLQYDTLQQKGLTHFDCWASTFGETTTAIELAPEGTGYRARTRFAKFFNLPELMNLFKEVADIKTSDQLHLPVPKVKQETVVVKPSEIQQEMVASLSERAAAVHKGIVDPSVDNMLKITSDGRKIGLDQRLMNPLLPDDPGSKLNACVNNVRRIWEEGKDQKLTQLIFCDLSTPNENGFNVYGDIKAKLLAAGVPEQEVAFIHDAKTEVQKKELFAKVRTGQVRVLLGSTQKMGAGTNVQDLLVAVHHLDVGWRPADMTQRNGRIIRQGNRNPEVQIYQYVTEGTFDAYLYQTLENKQKVRPDRVQ